jgi:tetratricopeptide (TPR) repeat protein
LLETAGIAVNGNALLSKAPLAEVDHSVGLTHERIDKTRVQGPEDIASSKSSAPVVADNIVHSPPVLTTGLAELDASQSGRQGHNSAGVSIPTRAVASVLTPATPPQTAANPSFTPSVTHDATLIERPHTSIAARNTITAVDARRIRVRADAGDDYMRRGEYSQAITSYEQALAISPGDGQLQRRIERARRAKATEAQILWPSPP